MVNIKEEITNQRSGTHYIKLSELNKLEEQLNILHEINIFDKYKMSYTYKACDDYIVLAIYKSFNFI